LNLDPDDSEGKTNRDTLTREFARFVLLKTIESTPCHVVDLGKMEIGKSSPDKRFSSNFLTVSLKAATKNSEAYEYPSRPRNPLIVLGPVATGITWGMDRHSDWKENLPVFLQERNTQTSFYDLACFVLRQRILDDTTETLEKSLIGGLSEIFTQDLVEYWSKQLSLEKVYVQENEHPYQATSPRPFEDHSWLGNTEEADGVLALKTRISYLEGLLRMHHIAFEE